MTVAVDVGNDDREQLTDGNLQLFFLLLYLICFFSYDATIGAH